jgi:hypothetical protein
MKRTFGHGLSLDSSSQHPIEALASSRDGNNLLATHGSFGSSHERRRLNFVGAVLQEQKKRRA